MSDNPSQTLPAVDDMRADWAVVAPLMGGTKAMRAAGKALLPQYPAEDDDAYRARLAQSTLLPAYRETVGNMTDRVFAEPLQLGDDVLEEIAGWCLDIDRAGSDLNNWAVNWFRTGLSHGLCHALVEYPRANGVRTRADEIKAGLRPYAVLIRPEHVLGWRADSGRLVQVRYLESVEEQDGEFSIKAVEQVRVLEPGRWRVFRQDEKGGWLLHDEGMTSLASIPWVTFYTGRTGLMTARPPLLELAHLNVKHWQSQSDQDNILHVIRVPILVRKGMETRYDTEGNPLPAEFKVGAGTLTDLPRDGDMAYVEHTGNAVGAGREALQDLIAEMRMAGAKLIQQDKSKQTKTATQAAEDAAQELSPLARMAGQFSDCLAQLLQFMADYRGLPDGGSVEVRGNFSQDYAPEVSLPQLLAMANAGRLSDETLFSEFQRRGVISDEHDWATEQERISSQGPAPGVM